MSGSVYEPSLMTANDILKPLLVNATDFLSSEQDLTYFGINFARINLLALYCPCTFYF